VKFTNDNCTLNCLLNFIHDLDCRCCNFFRINNKLILCENSFSFHWAAVLCSNPISYSIIHNVMNNDLQSQICSRYYVYAYIHHGHIWHRNKLSRCQLELLVSCYNDEHQTSLKRDSSSYPVAPECCVSHTLRLKYFTDLHLMFCEPSSLKLNVPLSGMRNVMSHINDPKDFCRTIISFA
jgi:hypothetical protein